MLLNSMFGPFFQNLRALLIGLSAYTSRDNNLKQIMNICSHYTCNYVYFYYIATLEKILNETSHFLPTLHKIDMAMKLKENVAKLSLRYFHTSIPGKKKI